jgi:hypothetical protein|tara:strand:- start:40 stop:327 length:288 start_codon:yes stop_codon:yes gene_type:complete
MTHFIAIPQDPNGDLLPLDISMPGYLLTNHRQMPALHERMNRAGYILFPTDTDDTSLFPDMAAALLRDHGIQTVPEIGPHDYHYLRLPDNMEYDR